MDELKIIKEKIVKRKEEYENFVKKLGELIQPQNYKNITRGELVDKTEEIFTNFYKGGMNKWAKEFINDFKTEKIFMGTESGVLYVIRIMEAKIKELERVLSLF